MNSLNNTKFNFIYILYKDMNFLSSHKNFHIIVIECIFNIL